MSACKPHLADAEAVQAVYSIAAIDTIGDVGAPPIVLVPRDNANALKFRDAASLRATGSGTLRTTGRVHLIASSNRDTDSERNENVGARDLGTMVTWGPIEHTPGNLVYVSPVHLGPHDGIDSRVAVRVRYDMHEGWIEREIDSAVLLVKGGLLVPMQPVYFTKGVSPGEAGNTKGCGMLLEAWKKLTRPESPCAGPRDWVVNDDGTISPRAANFLALGVADMPGEG